MRIFFLLNKAATVHSFFSHFRILKSIFFSKRALMAPSQIRSDFISTFFLFHIFRILVIHATIAHKQHILRNVYQKLCILYKYLYYSMEVLYGSKKTLSVLEKNIHDSAITSALSEEIKINLILILYLISKLII